MLERSDNDNSIITYYYVIITSLLLHYYVIITSLLHIITNPLLRVITSLLCHYYVIITSLLHSLLHIITSIITCYYVIILRTPGLGSEPSHPPEPDTSHMSLPHLTHLMVQWLRRAPATCCQWRRRSINTALIECPSLSATGSTATLPEPGTLSEQSMMGPC